MTAPAMPQLYKFTTADQKSPTGTGAWTINRWRSVRGPLVACRNGLHAAPIDNLMPFLHEALWRVEIGDTFIWHEDGMGRKLVARRMRLVERIETWNTRTARLFAADCAEHVLKNFEDRYPDDTRPRAAIEVVRRFARGEATEDALSAAYRAASSAAYRAAGRAAYRAAGRAAGSAADSAAGRAAGRAAYSAAGRAAGRAAYRAAGRAAGRAAYRAAGSAADSAADRAAYSAASRAADSAAYSAAYRAEREWQARLLADTLGLVYDAVAVPS